MTNEIKPCPFCGHAGLEFGDGSTYRWGLASCGGRGATAGEVRRSYPDDGKWHTEAIKEWNTRAAPAAPKGPQQVEAMAHLIAWRYKKSSDPAHSDTYTFNRATLLQFAAALQSPGSVEGGAG